MQFIFPYLDPEPESNVAVLINKHVKDMCFDAAYVLCAFHREYSTNVYCDERKLYDTISTHRTYQKWLAESFGNYQWLYSFFDCCLAEHAARFDKEHPCQSLLLPLADYVEPTSNFWRRHLNLAPSLPPLLINSRFYLDDNNRPCKPEIPAIPTLRGTPPARRSSPKVSVLNSYRNWYKSEIIPYGKYSGRLSSAMPSWFMQDMQWEDANGPLVTANRVGGL